MIETPGFCSLVWSYDGAAVRNAHRKFPEGEILHLQTDSCSLFHGDPTIAKSRPHWAEAKGQPASSEGPQHPGQQRRMEMLPQREMSCFNGTWTKARKGFYMTQRSEISFGGIFRQGWSHARGSWFHSSLHKIEASPYQGGNSIYRTDRSRNPVSKGAYLCLWRISKIVTGCCGFAHEAKEGFVCWPMAATVCVTGYKILIYYRGRVGFRLRLRYSFRDREERYRK